ncbi:unnamed protein product [Caenorhabditis brenneri]
MCSTHRSSLPRSGDRKNNRWRQAAPAGLRISYPRSLADLRVRYTDIRRSAELGRQILLAGTGQLSVNSSAHHTGAACLTQEIVIGKLPRVVCSIERHSCPWFSADLRVRYTDFRRSAELGQQRAYWAASTHCSADRERQAA